MNKWMPAFESQLAVLTNIDRFLRSSDVPRDIRVGMTTDRAILKRADPYFFSSDAVAALWQAQPGVPLDTRLDLATFPIQFGFLYFETPIPLRTTQTANHKGVNDKGVRAIAIGSVRNPHAMLADGSTGEAKELWGSVYIQDDEQSWPIPSQTWVWQDGEDVAQMLGRLAAMYEHKYGPGGDFIKTYADGDLMGVKSYVEISVQLTRFILAAVAWIGQRVVTSEDGVVERHRRKEMTRMHDRTISAVKVVELPRRQGGSGVATGDPTREYSHRWTVDGHWRNARVGVGREQRRLVFVHPYVKGPDDKPLIVKERVFVVKGEGR